MPETIELKKGDAAMVFHADGTMEAMMPRMEDGEGLSPTSIAATSTRTRARC